MARRFPARKARHGEIERSPEQVDGRNLAEEPGAKPRKHPVDLHQGAVEPLDRVTVVRSRRGVYGKGLGIGNLVRRTMDEHAAAEPIDQGCCPFQEIGNAHRFQRKAHARLKGLAHQEMLPEIEGQSDGRAAIGH
jgi:hypothetical protein